LLFIPNSTPPPKSCAIIPLELTSNQIQCSFAANKNNHGNNYY
jgi:hypothetical protein